MTLAVDPLAGPSDASLARVAARAAAERPGWLFYVGWAVALGVLLGFDWEWFRELRIRSDARGKTREVARMAREPAVLRATQEVAMWATPVDGLGSGADWGRDADTGEGRGLVLTEAREGVLGFSAYLIRRARRLNALVPPR